MVGGTVSHYRIVEKIGEGGMGVVYKAIDTRLGREVALKFITSSMISSKQANEHFIREATSAASLDHQNICAVHEIEEFEGIPFIVMAYCEGPTLREMINEGPLPLPKAINIIAQVADGLQCAHEKGIIHRDIKPSNIIVEREGRRPKITDFGLARQVDSGASRTTTSRTGTLAYTSPEQMAGEIADTRSDIWSVGVTLYEMLTGRLPFEGEYDASVMYNIMNNPPDLAKLPGGEAGRFVSGIIDKALQKNPALRYQEMKELSYDLNMAAELLAGGKSAPPPVIKRPMPVIFRKTDGEPFVSLGVRPMFLLVLTVIAVPFIIWSVARIEPPGDKRGSVSFAAADTVKSEADIVFERGKAAYDGGDQTKGITLIEESIRIDPQHIEALKTLATYYNAGGDSKKAADYIDRAKKIAIRKGGSIDLLKCNIVEAYVWHDWDMAVRNLESLLEETPGDIRAHVNLGYVLSRYKGDYDRAIKYFEKAVSLDPGNGHGLTNAAWNHMGNALLYSGRFDEAMEAFEKYRELSPGSPDPVNSIAGACCFSGRYDEAIRLAEESIAGNNHNFKYFEILGRSYLARGQWRKAADAFNNYIGAAPSQGYKTAGQVCLAQLYLLQGDRAAFDAQIANMLSIDPNSVKAMWLSGLAALRFDNDTGLATAFLEKIRSVTSDPLVYDETPCERHLSGEILLAMGRHGEAIEELVAAAESSRREFCYFGRELAAALVSAGRADEAEKRCAKLLQYNGNDYVLLMLMDRIYSMKNDAAGARLYRDRALAVLGKAEPGFVPLESYISKSTI